MANHLSQHDLLNRESSALLGFVSFVEDQIVIDMILFLGFTFYSIGLILCFGTSTMLF